MELLLLTLAALVGVLLLVGLIGKLIRGWTWKEYFRSFLDWTNWF